jgi:cytochrome c-type biogenesis protein
MQQLFAQLTRALEQAPSVALAAAFLWGVLSVVLSPCHLAGVPLLVAFIGGQGKLKTGRALLLSALFATGVLATIVVLGVITAILGRVAGDAGGYGNYLVAALFFLVGLHLLGVIPMPWSGLGQVNTKMRGATAALFLGLIFGAALGPCTFAYMAPVLGIAFKVASTSAVYATGLLLMYGLGHCAVLVAAGASTGMVQSYLDWNERSRGAVIAKRACGVLVLIGGLYLIYVA